MNAHEVPEPILNSPFEEPEAHWWITEHDPPEQRAGRRKVADRGDARFSDVVLVVCPNVTIRNRLEELKPQGGEASLYRSRDLVPPHLMPQLARGHVLVTNWHVFEPKSVQVAGQSARVLRAGRRVRTRETIRIGARTTTARGTRYLTPEDLERQAAAGPAVPRWSVRGASSAWT